MVLLYAYLVGFIVAAMLLGAICLPLSRRHTGHPADDPSIFIFAAFIWPLLLVAAGIALALMIPAYLGYFAREKVWPTND